MTIDNPITLTADAAAELLGLATSTLAKLRLSGNGPVYCKLGRRVVYRREDLEAWLESRVVRNTSDADARLPKSLTGKRPELTDGRTKALTDLGPMGGPARAASRTAHPARAEYRQPLECPARAAMGLDRFQPRRDAAPGTGAPESKRRPSAAA
jgi:predicted DNA-binding transcriptional regulator AlpA